MDRVRRFLEPGPVVLLSTASKTTRNVMTLGRHMMLGDDLVGTYLSPGNHSHDLARKSRACVINLPTAEMFDTMVRIGNCSGRDGDKFERLGLTMIDAVDVAAPMIAECHASFECRLHETRITYDYPLSCGAWSVPTSRRGRHCRARCTIAAKTAS